MHVRAQGIMRLIHGIHRKEYMKVQSQHSIQYRGKKMCRSRVAVREKNTQRSSPGSAMSPYCMPQWRTGSALSQTSNTWSTYGKASAKRAHTARERT